MSRPIAGLSDCVEYNPRYFPEPHIYRPSRWHGLSNDSEVFTAFGLGACYIEPDVLTSADVATYTGPRTCIGRRFATTEAVCFLALLLRDWRVEPILREGETRLDWQDRVLQAHLKLTLAVRDVPIRFIRRN
jgi:cytochrome P450